MPATMSSTPTTASRSLPLNTANLLALGPDVCVPLYDRSAVTAGIVHIGVGGFHRAHQAVYLDDLLHQPGSEAFGICGLGLLPQDRAMRDALRSQDFLYTLVTRSAAGEEARVIGSIVDFVLAPDDPEAAIARLASPATKIVTLTITEGGYCENKATGQLDFSIPAIAQDLEHPEQPRGVYGYLAAALRRRMTAGQLPFTIMSCDNLLNNGSICRRMLLSFLTRQDPQLAEWVTREGAFPNTMVDRITPATTQDHRDLVRSRFGIEDAWPVTTEPFIQWVIEDRFVQGRPAWEKVGAQLVSDVEPYERIKIRLLNGSHQVLCYIGMLLGYRFAPQGMSDPMIVSAITRYMDDEVTPLLHAVPGMELEAYKQTLRERFANPAINDQLGRIGTDGSARVAEFVLPTLREQLLRDGPINVAAFTVAAWIRFLQGRDDTGAAMPFSDVMGPSLQELARKGGADPSAVLSIGEMFGSQLPQCPRFVTAVRGYLASFHERGARATLEQLVGANT